MLVKRLPDVSYVHHHGTSSSSRIRLMYYSQVPKNGRFLSAEDADKDASIA